ncbi:hypothetical protein NB688_000573 [Xanthomonas sacchari]|uniref:Resolvase HTH domain-containing protein n=1 Tax=Xanthomonas sacchari TaxID=56458 RepID=A0ABT3DTY5_9XANT|nr:helix-turn-helix domain-containing protein [Xanthomonas sacchari]MCW0398759.1 hypothetical protein [Xanthomonas sacchari]MCW0418407.1 hypothetical protein [Xanthomonas sacchari]UYK72530.1 helix-turn-helix domain-containing protein [Xanthomonas sacchari]
MAEDIKADELMDHLRSQFAASIRSAIDGLPAHQALQVADLLCAVQMDVLAGKRVSYRAKPDINAEAVAEAWRRGMTVAEITRQFKISRTAAYKYHPSRSAGRSRIG